MSRTGERSPNLDASHAPALQGQLPAPGGTRHWWSKGTTSLIEMSLICTSPASSERLVPVAITPAPARPSLVASRTYRTSAPTMATAS